MSEEKKYSAREVAIAVLAKARQMMEKTTLAKKEEAAPKVAEYSSGMHNVAYYSNKSFQKSEALDYGFEPFRATELTSSEKAAAEELMKNEELSKSWDSMVHHLEKPKKEGGGGYSKDSAEKIAGSINNKYVHHYGKSEDMKKHGLSPAQIKAKMNKGTPTPAPSLQMSEKIKKAENPDEKQDAQLGEDVEHLCEDHFKANADAERKEGHKLVAKSECTMCKAMSKNENIVKPTPGSGQGDTLRRTPAEAKWQMDKSEKFAELYEMLEVMEKAEKSKHDRCVEDVERNSPDVKNPHAVCVAEGVRPAKWKKGEMEKADQKGVHNVGLYNPKRLGGEKSEAGRSLKEGKKIDAYTTHGKVLGELKDMPKPNLPKSEDMKKHGLSPAQIKAKMNKGENGQGSGIKEKPSNSLDPRIPEDKYSGTIKDYEDYEPKAGKSTEEDHRQMKQISPEDNPVERREGNNPEPGSVPRAKGREKLDLFTKHIAAKRAMKKGICLG